MKTIMSSLLPKQNKLSKTRDEKECERMNVNNKPKETAESILFSFCMMSLFFSINHGTVLACFSLASGEFGETLGSYSLGVLYLVYTISAMLFAIPILETLEQKWTLALGLWTYCFYVASFFLARFLNFSSLWGKWFLVLSGSVLGGLGASVLWVAQGAYFSNCAKHYASLKGIAETDATSYMSGIFATFYLGFEVVFKVISSFLQVIKCGDDWHGDFITGDCQNEEAKNEAEVFVFSIYTIAAIGSAAAICFIRDIPSFAPKIISAGEENKVDINSQRSYATSPPINDREVSLTELIKHKRSTKWYAKLLETLGYLLRNKKMQLMVLINVQFGFVSAYLNSYITGEVIPKGLGLSKVGYLTAIIPIVATATSLPLSYIGNKLQSKKQTMTFGILCFFVFGLIFLITPKETVGHWGPLIILFIMYGFGRAVWEGPNKAVFADFFAHENPDAAFANIVLQNGAATTIAFFLFPSFSPIVKGAIVSVTGVLALFSYLRANSIYEFEQGQIVHPLIHDDVEIM